MRRDLILYTLALSFLVACALTPRDTGKAFMFALTPIKAAVNKNIPIVDEHLVIDLPITAPELDTYRIALTRDNTQWDYYAGARWVEFLPALVQDSLTKTVEDSKLYRAVTTDEAGISGDRILKVEIRTFQAAYEGEDNIPLIKIRMTAHLVKNAGRVPLASFEAMAIKRASGNRLSQIQSAFNAAFGEAQQALADQLQKDTQ